MCAAAAALLVFAVPASGADAPVPTAADFGALPFLTDPVLSPDGSMLAAKSSAGGKSRVVVIRLDAAAAGKKLQVVEVPDKHHVEWVRWAGNGRLLFSLNFALDWTKEEIRSTRLVSYEIAADKLAFVGLRRQGLDGDDIVFVDPEGEYVLLSTQRTYFSYPSVMRIDLATNKAREVVGARPDVWEWFADPKGVVRAGVGTRSGKWWVYYRADGQSDFERTSKRDYDEDDSVDRFVPVTGSDKGYAIATGRSGRFGLYEYDFRTDQLGKPIYENPQYDIDDFDLTPSGEVRAVHYVDDRSRIEWLDPAFKKLQASFDRALPGQINRVVSISRDQNRMLVWSGSASDPGLYFLFDRKLSRMDQVAAPFAALEGKQLAQMQSVTYKARDGLEIAAYLTLPPGRPDMGLPLVILPHGGPFLRDKWEYDAWVQFLASRGYAVLQPNYRGSTGYGREFVEKGNGQFGRGMQDDLDDGVKWMVDRGTADANRVCIMGGSYGGYAAMIAAFRNPEIYRCAISFAGLSDVSAQLRYNRRSFAAERYYRDWRERVQGDKSFELDTISPLAQAARVAIPLLIVHGTDDDVVPPFQSRRMHEALVKLGRKHDFHLYEGEAHGFADPANSTDFLTRVGAFLDQHNPR